MKNVALITGASSGIGLELARIHAQNGGDVVLVARNEKALHALKDELLSLYNTNVLCIPIDLSIEGAAKEVYEITQSENIQVDYVINNAGFGNITAFSDSSLSIDRSMVQLNCIALMELTYYFLRPMLALNKGRILNVSSVASLMAGPNQAVYFASKAFVTSLSNAIAGELYQSKVTVTTLLPGPTKTNFGSIAGMEKTPFYLFTSSAHKVAEDGYRGMLKGKLNVLTGLSILQRIAVFFIPFIPKRVALWIVRKGQEPAYVKSK